MLKKSKNSRYEKKSQSLKLVCLAVIVCIAVIMVILLAKRFIPTSEKMNGYDYFDVSHESQGVMVMIDGDQDNDIGVNIDGSVYIPHEYVADKINVRFYYDLENKAVFYTDSDKTYIFTPDDTEVTDNKGGSYTTDIPVVKLINDKIYINFKYVAEHTNISYVYAQGPQRLVIDTLSDERSCVTVEKDTQVRYRGGIKSKVLEEVKAGDSLYYISTVDEWMEVRTKSGYTGYIKSSKVSDVAINVAPEKIYSDDYKHILREDKINMVWFQTTSLAGNAQAQELLAKTQGVNTISPTWYSISDNSGNLSSISSEEFVKSMHSKGIQVWPLVNDFNKDVDYKQVYSSYTSRNKMIDTLINDANKYGYDGLNIDFENIKTDYAQDFLQFIRELAVKCHENNIILSTDNYKPESYNWCYDLKEQASYADYIIIMGYDEHYNGSDAGSVASLGFVEEGIKDVTKMVPENQVINAIPFYTRIWTEKDGETTSKAVGMQEALKTANESNASFKWDEESGQNYCEYSSGGRTVKIWLEDTTSIEAKMKLYSKYNLAGVSGWKLGLESPEVWNIIEENLNY